jgi:hypothetical protein
MAQDSRNTENAVADLSQVADPSQVADHPGLTGDPNWHLKTIDPPWDSNEGPLSYFGDGSISASEVEALFQASRALLDADPWNADPWYESLRLDIPQLGITSGMIVLEDSYVDCNGFTLFASDMSHNTYLDFVWASDKPSEATDLGVTSLSLDFRAESDLPATMRGEIDRHGWPALEDDSYPWLKYRHRSRTLLQPTHHVFDILMAAAHALTQFYTQYADELLDEDLESLSQVYTVHQNRKTRINYPYGVSVAFERPGPRWPEADDWPAPPSRATKIPRNAPCPCGSGKKYKKCCMKKGELAW